MWKRFKLLCVKGSPLIGMKSISESLATSLDEQIDEKGVVKIIGDSKQISNETVNLNSRKSFRLLSPFNINLQPELKIPLKDKSPGFFFFFFL
jgi:hypothetical protein